MHRLIKLVLSCTLLYAGCGTGEEITSQTAQEAALSGPTITRSGTSSARTVGSSSLRGPGLEIDGGRELGSYLLATYSITPGLYNTTAALTVTPASGAAFVVMLLGSGSRYSTRQLRLERRPGSSELAAATPTGNVACGTVASGTPTGVTLVVDSSSRTFDVLINGAATVCADLPTTVQLPIVGAGMMDASNEGYGGRVVFTDLAVF